MHDGVRSSAWPFECGHALFLRVRSVAGIRVMSRCVRCDAFDGCAWHVCTCARVLSVEVLSQITPTLQTRPGARRRERLAVWHRSGLHVAPRRASLRLRTSQSRFGRFRPLSVAFGRRCRAPSPEVPGHPNFMFNAHSPPIRHSPTRVASSPLAHCRQPHGHPRPSAHRPETVWCVQCLTV